MTTTLTTPTRRRLLCTLSLLIAALSAPAIAHAQTVTRGPYLQRGSDTQMTFRWRTSVATNSRVSYGTTQGSLTSQVDNPTSTTEHEIRVTGLSANTKYFYAVGTTSGILAGNTADHFVVTAPPTGTAKPTRVWVLGDPGTQSSVQVAVRDAYVNFTGTTHTDLWLMLGDNAYSSGTDSEYQGAVFNMYPTILRKSVLFPARGNHDADNAVYTNIFSMPAAAEAGGVASGTEAYYSFNYGNIHFVVLDSFGSSRTATSPMATWLQNDLAANTQTWTIAYWHHPPYSKGSHNSDTESNLIDMRQNFNPILEANGVDLVLGGHSHAYERSFFIDGHYGSSSTFSPATHVEQPGDGRVGGNGAYTKSSTTPIPHAGAVYNVAGSSGQTSGGSLNHAAMFISLNTAGSVVLDINGNRLDSRFLTSTGATADTYTIIKSTGGGPPPAPTGLAATAGNAQVALTWNASAGATGYNVKRATVSGGPYTTIVSGITTTSHTDTTVTNGVTYFYVVSAVNGAGQSGNSNEVSATPTGTPPAVPAAPSNLVASLGNGKGKIVLTWTDNSNNETGFQLERATAPTGPFTVVVQTAANVTSFTNTGLARNTTYYYRVNAFNGAGSSAYSNTASATTQ